MPPVPDMLKLMRDQGELEQYVSLYAKACSRGVNEPFDFNLNQLRRDNEDEVEINALCILVDFDDNEADQDRHSVAEFQQMLFSMDEYESGSMRDWYLENSLDEVHIVGRVFGWYRMPRDYSYYVDGQRGFGDYPQNAQGLVRDALLAADDDVDYAEYDNSGDGVVEALFIVHAGPGYEETLDNDMIHSHAWNVPDLRLDGVTFARYAMEPETGEIGVFGHELGHSFFGLPDLYDYSQESAGVGMWSMMAGGSWGGGGRRPVHFDAWCKSRIGFIEPLEIVENRTGIRQEPVETGGEVYVTWRNGIVRRQYFMLENRQHIGFDRSLPGAGLLIWHIDEARGNNDHPWWPGRGGDVHFKVALEQADGRYHLEHDINSGDGGDPWPGLTWKFLFNRFSEPDSRDYHGETTNVTIYDIESVGDLDVVYNVGLTSAAGPEDLALFILDRIPEDHTYPHPDNEDELIDEATLAVNMFAEAGVDPAGWDVELPEVMDDFSAILYFESWREGDDAGGGLSIDEQRRLAEFLDNGGRLVLVGPDVATNLQSDDSPLWSYLNAECSGEGNPAEEGNIRLVRTANGTRLAGMSFPFKQNGMCDHYVDIVGPTDDANLLFADQSRNPRGVITLGENGYRLILQPFLFGGLVDWGSRKSTLITRYFEQLLFYLSTPLENLPSPAVPQSFSIISAYPNPFNSALKVSFKGLPSGAFLEVFDAVGRSIGRLDMTASSGSIDWRPEGLPTGSYWIVPVGVEGSTSFKVVYLK